MDSRGKDMKGQEERRREEKAKGKGREMKCNAIELNGIVECRQFKVK
jgi:hypothetical protein